MTTMVLWLQTRRQASTPAQLKAVEVTAVPTFQFLTAFRANSTMLEERIAQAVLALTLKDTWATAMR